MYFQLKYFTFLELELIIIFYRKPKHVREPSSSIGYDVKSENPAAKSPACDIEKAGPTYVFFFFAISIVTIFILF